jgi:hypothetical protein
MRTWPRTPEKAKTSLLHTGWSVLRIVRERCFCSPRLSLAYLRHTQCFTISVH